MPAPAPANPFRPGAGHSPPYLAGRDDETRDFQRLLEQEVVLKNLVLTGLRGVGKTVLLAELKPLATSAGWLWVGDDLSESASLTEERIVTRLLTDLATVTSSIVIDRRTVAALGFGRPARTVELRLSFDVLWQQFQHTPGLVSDKLKSVLELVWAGLRSSRSRGIIFAYDEAQNLADHADAQQYPVSLLLDVFQSLQKKELPLMLVLVGLPTLYPRLVEARTFAERMFHVLFLDRLTDAQCRDAIVKPIEAAGGPLPLTDKLVRQITRESGGYPYFVQFICREVYDIAVQKRRASRRLTVNMEDVTRKLDMDFFAGRWSRATDRQRDLLRAIADLPNCDEEFTVQQIVARSRARTAAAFSASHVNQMLGKLSENGLVYKNRHGRYSFAVPLLGRFIRRQAAA
jgi:type II secretory pathway predicted ATPase ExeA